MPGDLMRVILMHQRCCGRVSFLNSVSYRLIPLSLSSHYFSNPPPCLPIEPTCSSTLRVSIALVGKYTGMSDAYLSVLKALKHAATHAKRDLDLVWIESSDLEDVSPAQAAEEAATAAEATSSAGAAASSSSSSSSSSTTTSAEDSSAASTSPLEKHQAAWAKLKAVDGIIVPGGFGDRGVEGKILTAKYAREHRVPYLGVCLGMQMLVVEYARHVLGRADANSTEFNKDTKHPTV